MAAAPTMPTAANISSSIGGFGAAAQSLFTGFAQEKLAGGYAMSQEGYYKAARYSDVNADYARKDKDIKLQIADREIFKSLGGQAADVAGAGFTASGTALDLLRDSAAQGELQKELVTIQGDIAITGYKQQAEALRTQGDVAGQQAAAARTAAKGSFISAGITAVASMAMLFSDRRLKFGITKIGRAADLDVYAYYYLWRPLKIRVGYMADEVERLYPEAVSRHWTGFKMVNYAKVLDHA